MARRSNSYTFEDERGGATFSGTHWRSSYGSKTGASALPSLPGEAPAVPAAPAVPPMLSTASPGDPDDNYVEFDFGHVDPSGPYFAEHNILTASIKEAPEAAAAAATAATAAAANASNGPNGPGTPDGPYAPDAPDDFFNLGTDWKAMKTVAEMDFYNDRGELEFGSNGLFDKNGLITQQPGSRGYTKIDTEEQMAKYAELDRRTDFLFQRCAAARPKAAYAEADASDDSEYDDDDNLQLEETLDNTKSMLTDAQKFAYVGLVKLIAVDMATDLARLKHHTLSRIAKSLSAGQQSFAKWATYVTTKLFEHLELSKEEQRMIENLSVHGLEVSDLSVSLVGVKVQVDDPGRLQRVDLVWILVCDLFLLLLSEGYYDSRSRLLVIRFSQHLGVSPLEVFQFERRLIDSLELEAKADKLIENKDELLSDRTFIDRHIKKNKKKRLAYIGLATLGGSLAIGLLAGLLAPVIGAGLAAGLTTVGITGTGGFLAGVGGSAIITTGGVFAGARVGSKAGLRRLGEVHTFELKPLHNNKRTLLIVTVSGWMNGALDDVRLPFLTVDPVMGDMFSLLWEPEMLQSMGQTINILASEALTTLIQQILGATVLTALMSAIQLPMAILKLSYILDNPWNVSLDRAWKAGKILADTLIAGNLGVRPITLVGFSLGARLIYSCLIDMAKRGGLGLIENVIILGTPITVKSDQLALARLVVSGRFINGYLKKDWILGYLFRATGGGIQSVAGLQEVTSVHGIENVDCTDLVEGHMSYRKAIPKILKRLEWEVLSEEFLEIEEPDSEQGERTRQLIHEFDEARAKMLEEQEGEAAEKRAAPKTWKNWLKLGKKKEWWEVYGSQPQQEHESSATAAPAAAAAPSAIFDLGALQHEVQDIERLARDADALEATRRQVDLYGPRPLATNEDTEEVEVPSLMDRVTSAMIDKLAPST